MFNDSINNTQLLSNWTKQTN